MKRKSLISDTDSERFCKEGNAIQECLSKIPVFSQVQLEVDIVEHPHQGTVYHLLALTPETDSNELWLFMWGFVWGRHSANEGLKLASMG